MWILWISSWWAGRTRPLLSSLKNCGELRKLLVNWGWDNVPIKSQIQRMWWSDKGREDPVLTWGRILQPVMRTGWLANFIFGCTQWLGDSVKLFRTEKKKNCFFIPFCDKDIQLGDWGRKSRMLVCGVQKGLGRLRYWVEYGTLSHCYMGTC